jgi:hypothetical protein
MPTNGVRVTNAEIYQLLLETNRRVGSVEQTMRETLKPGLDDARARITSLETNKADREIVVKTEGRLEKVEMRVYALLAGLIAALLGAKQLGIF